jgi:hypothetical protein
MPLKVIGAGLGRTGTMSLKVALEQLGIGRCYHMTECFPDPAAPPLWVEAAKGRPDWEAIFKGFSATADYPACSFWRELSAFYPEAKVVLSVRDADKWFDSTQATIFSPPLIEQLKGSPLREFFDGAVIGDFGDRIHDRDFMVDYFKRRNAEVVAALPKGRVLVYDVAEGWEPLCRFLEVPVPEAAFPRVNVREDMEALLSGVTGSDEESFVANLQSGARDHLRKAEGRG